MVTPNNATPLAFTLTMLDTEAPTPDNPNGRRLDVAAYHVDNTVPGRVVVQSLMYTALEMIVDGQPENGAHNYALDMVDRFFEELGSRLIEVDTTGQTTSDYDVIAADGDGGSE